jgi:hypothetical protein
MGYTTSPGAVISFSVEGAGSSQSQIDGVAQSMTRLTDTVNTSMNRLSSVVGVGFGSLESHITSLKSSALSLGRGLIIGSAAGMSIDAIKDKIVGVIDSMAHLKEISEKTGSSVENLSKLNFVAKQSGSDIDSVAMALSKLSKGMAGADNETKGAGLALNYLGISAKDATGNLKDPAVLFGEIAIKLDTYKDGAGKAAIAQALFGKAGADMLPTMKLLAEQGDLAIKVTDAQASAARQYTRDIAKLDAQKGMLFKTVAVALLPTMTDFANAMLDASKNTTTLGKGVKGMADDHSITAWADSAAMGVARLVDVITMLPRLLSAVTGSFQVVAADMKVIGTGTVDLSPKNIAKSIAGGKNPFADFNKALADRNQTLADANKRYEELWNYDGAAMEKAMATRIAARAKDTASARAAEQARNAADKIKPSLNYNTSGEDATGETAAQKEAAAYATLISAIRAKTEENRLELNVGVSLADSQKAQIKLDEELAAGKLKLTDAHLASARAALVEQAASEQALKLQVAQKDVTKFIAASTQAREESAAALNIEYAMYGKTTDARDIAMVAVKAEADMQKELDALREKGLPISGQILTQLAAERDARVLVEQATMGQGKALTYASQLAADNKRFAADSILSETGRAKALLEIDADTWRERIRLAGDGTEAQRQLQTQFDQWYQNQSIKPQLDAQRQMWASIDQTAHDTFISIFNSGKSAFDRLRDTLKNGLYDLLYQMTLKKWILNIGASVGFGGSGMAQAAGSMGDTGGSGLIGAANSASNLYKMSSNGFGGLLNTAGSTIATAGNMFGSSSMSAFGAGFAGNSAGTTMTASEMFANAGMTSEASAASMGSMAGAGLGILGGVAGGVLGGHAISGGYGSNGAVNTGTAIGAAVGSIVPVLGTALGALIGGLLGGVYNRTFGHKAPEIESQGIKGAYVDGTVSGDTYQKILEKGGWFTSDKRHTESQTLTGDAVKQITAGFDSIKSVSAGFASSLGVSADALKDYAKTFDIVTTGDKTKDAQALTDFFTGVSDEIAHKLVPNLDDFTKSGESASTALQRLAGDFQTTDQMAQLLGKSAEQVFRGTGMDTAAARERLIDASGGVSTLSQQAASYAQNYLTAAERLAPVAEAVSKAMGSLGLACVTTRDQFKATIDGLISSGAILTDSGAQEFASLMKLEEAFAEVHPEIDATANSLQAMKDSASSLLGGVDDAYSVLQKVVAREKAVLQTRIDAETAVVNKIKSLSDSLHGTLDGMRMPDQQAQDRAAAQAQIQAALATAKAGGKLPSADELKSALSIAGQSDPRQFATYQAYLSDFARTKNAIALLAGVSDDSLSVEQKSLDALTSQAGRLDDILASEQSQIDELKGQSTTLLSIDQGVAGLTAAILAAQSNPLVAAGSAINQAYQSALGRAPDASGLAYWQQQAAGGASTGSIVDAITNSPEAKVQALYHSLLGRGADAGGLQFWLSGGASMDAISAGIKNSAEYQHLHPFAVGANYIPEDMPALVHAGERIIPAADNRELMRRLSDPAATNAALVAEIRRLGVQLANQQLALNKIAASTKTQADVFNDANGGGFLRTKAVGK